MKFTTKHLFVFVIGIAFLLLTILFSSGCKQNNIPETSFALKIYLENSRPCSRGTSRGISLVGYRSALVYCKDKTIILDCSWPGWTKYYCTEIFRIKTTP